jgi:GR25 family glycosyltransferase involved in LPS biosynthesis
MKAFTIVIKDNSISETGFSTVLSSSKNVGNNNTFQIDRFDAIVPHTVEQTFKKYKVEWNYPLYKDEYDKELKLKKHVYKTSDHQVKKACALSHYSLWKKCIEINEPVLILEHDVLWTSRLDTEYLLKSKKQIIGINSPKGATRKWQTFASIVDQNKKEEIQDVPRIDNKEIPQGLAGASAYLIKPEGAKQVLDAVNKYGLWHNDAIICYQLFDDILGVTRKWYTTINQRLKSTTT